MGQDGEVKKALLTELSELAGYKIMLTIPGAVDEYFFTRGNNQPYLLLTLKHSDVVPEGARKEVYEIFVTFMLKTIREHIAS